MATRKFTASEVLDMLADGEDDSLKNANQQELEEESEDEAVVYGDYLGEDGEEIVIPFDLLHPGVRLALGILTQDELPCEINFLLLCDVGSEWWNSRGLNTLHCSLVRPKIVAASKNLTHMTECDSAEASDRSCVSDASWLLDCILYDQDLDLLLASEISLD